MARRYEYTIPLRDTKPDPDPEASLMARV